MIGARDQSFKEQVRSSIHLPGLVRRYTSLNKKNKGLCPFHRERSPSFSVDAERGLWHCFGCGRGGDVFSFIMEAQGVAFPIAVSILAQEAGLSLPEPAETRKESLKRWRERKRLLGVLKKARQHLDRAVDIQYRRLRVARNDLPPKKRWDSWNAEDYLRDQLIDCRFDRLDERRRMLTSFYDEVEERMRNA